MNWYLEVLKKYAVFEGRARRKEYWMFVLFNLLISLVFLIVDGVVGTTSESGQGVIGTVYSLAILIPSYAVGVRRMHDTNHSGWWIIVPIVSLIFAIQEGDRGPNRFGPDPKAVEALAT